jgi:hypothetical protein
MSAVNVFVVLLGVVLAEVSSTVRDSFPSADLGIQGVQGQLLTTIDNIKPFSGIDQGIGQVAPDFSNCINLLTAVNDSACLLTDIDVYPVNRSTDYMVTHFAAVFAAVSVLAVGVYWLKIDRHFSRVKCAAFSILFWFADVWVTVMLCPVVGVGLALHAYRKRGGVAAVSTAT